MIRNLITLCIRHHRVPDEFSMLQANALKVMQYKIQKIHGTSQKSYSPQYECIDVATLLIFICKIN